MEATFRLRRQTAGSGRFAQVTVSVTPADRFGVQISDRAFAWRLDAYGPDAVFGGDFDAEPAREAVEGARHAIGCLPDHTAPVRVSVTGVVDSYADTGPGDVRFAAANAVWRALGFEPGEHPLTGPDGLPVRPGGS